MINVIRMIGGVCLGIVGLIGLFVVITEGAPWHIWLACIVVLSLSIFLLYTAIFNIKYKRTTEHFLSEDEKPKQKQ